jgi:hypothetical protein
MLIERLGSVACLDRSMRTTGKRHWIYLGTGLLLLAAISVQWAGAQNYAGSITGVVRDPSGGVVPGASVVATNMSSGFTYPTRTNDDGIYTLANLPPATYELTIVAHGFKQFNRPDIIVTVTQNESVDAVLQVGATTQTVTVTGVSPLLQTQNGTTGQAVNNRYVLDLPLIGRMATDLSFLAPGVAEAANNTYGPANGLVTNWDSNGGRNMSAQVWLDGSNTTVPEQNTSIQISIYNPPVDAIQEFTVQQSGLSAKYGFSGNTIVNMVLKSGTNQYHGDAYEFNQYEPWNAINWFTDRAGQTPAVSRTNTFGGSFGGPIQKNKMFFFGDFEGTRSSSPNTYSEGMPSMAERNGDFSELCADNGGTFNAAGACSAAEGQLWDPMTSYYNSATGLRTMTGIIPNDNLATYQSPGSPLLAGTPFEPSATPGNLINPVALKAMSYFPLPNLNVGTPAYNPFDNWSAVGVGVSTANRFDIKIDRQITDMTHITGRYSEEWDLGTNSLSAWNSPMDPNLEDDNSTKRIAPVISLTHNFSPTFLITATLGYTRQFQHDPGIIGEFPSWSNVTDLGLPAYDLTSGYDLPPSFDIAGGYNTALGGQGSLQYRYSLNTYDLDVNLDKTFGHHNLEFGGELREFRTAFEQDGSANGYWEMDQTGMSQTPLGGTGGDAMASFLTGFPQSDQYEIPFASDTANFEYGLYIQDEWHVTPHLTLDPGLRWNLILPSVSKFNQQEWFNPSVVNPISNDHITLSTAAAAVFSNAGIPVPNLSTLYGGLQFAGVSGNSNYQVNPSYTDFAPRFGFAYNMRHNIVIRGSYGIFYAAPDYTAHGSGLGGTAGFEPYTFAPTTMGSNGYTPWASLTSPFPPPDFSPMSDAGLLLPTGSSLGLATNLGVGLSSPYVRSWNQVPYMQSWNIGIQHQFGSVLVGAEYVGTKGTHLYFGGAGQLDYLGPQIQHYSSAQIQALTTYVPNPFEGLITTPGCGICGPTIQAANLAVSFPEFPGAGAAPPPWANSEYNSLQLSVQKNFSHGLQILGNYTWEKALDDASVYGSNTSWTAGTTVTPQDPNDLRLEYSLSDYDEPQILNIAYVYQLPFGHGKAFGGSWSRPLNLILGGWQTQGVWRFDSSEPLGFSSNSSVSLPTWGTQRPNFSGAITRNKGSETSMVAQYFANPQVASEPAPFTLGNGPRVSDIFAPATEDVDLSLFKEIPIKKLGEAGRLELRLETFNALNHVQFSAPNTTVGQGSFGLITGQANSPRQVQIAAKVYW